MESSLWLTVILILVIAPVSVLGILFGKGAKTLLASWGVLLLAILILSWLPFGTKGGTTISSSPPEQGGGSQLPTHALSRECVVYAREKNGNQVIELCMDVKK